MLEAIALTWGKALEGVDEAGEEIIKEPIH